MPPDDYTLKVSPTTLTLEVGNTQTLKAEYGGKDTLSWNSSNTDVATVSSKGKVTAKAAGTAVITVTDGVKKSQCAVTVKAAADAASLTINTPKNTTIFVGETRKLDYTYTGTDKVTFESWDTSILTIDSNGKMKGVSEGVVGVQVTAGKLYKFVDIVVKSKANAATSIKITNMQGPLFDGVTKHVGNYMSFRAYSKPDENPITVATSNADVISVETRIVNTFYSEITLKFKAAGSATITLTSEDGNVVYKYKVNVKSEYSCYPGKEKLTPEEFANACTQVMVENGFTYSTGCTSYRVWTVGPNELTWTNAKANGQGCVRSWYPQGDRKCWISYEGTDENGNYVFYTRWA